MATGVSELRDLFWSDVDAWARLWLRGEGRNAGRHGGRAWVVALHLLWTHLGLRAALLYRLSHVLHRRGVRVLPQMLSRLNVMLHGFDIPASVEIGPGLYIPHPVGTVVMAERIGARCTLVSCVTVGMRHEPSFPTLGDDVYVGAGARILGDVTVGDGARIGANAVVLHDVPPQAAAVGVPARILPAK
jgi:serine O-acetyltransferase